MHPFILQIFHRVVETDRVMEDLDDKQVQSIIDLAVMSMMS